jgi:hypothetical protein
MECWTSAFNAQGSRPFYSSCTVRSSQNICSSSGGAQEKGKERMKLSVYHKIGGKTSMGPSYFAL